MKKLIVIVLTLVIVNSCKTKISNIDLNAPVDKNITEKIKHNLAEAKKEGSYVARNLTQKDFKENKNRVLGRFLILRKELLNSYPSYKNKDFILIEQINIEVFDYAGYLIIDDSIYSNRSGKIFSYQNIESFLAKKPQMGGFIIRTLNKEKPVLDSDGTNPNCHHGCLSKPMITVVKNGRVIDFYEAEIVRK